LGQIFAINGYAYAVMSNHTLIALHVNAQQAKNGLVIEVLERRHQLHKGTYLTKAYLNEELRSQLDESQLQTALETALETAKVYRDRLYDLSGLMHELNESITRQANGRMPAPVSFIRHHPWRSPFGPAKAVLFCFRQNSGKAVLNLKLCSMKPTEPHQHTLMTAEMPAKSHVLS
jgi:hypothetical protein